MFYKIDIIIIKLTNISPLINANVFDILYSLVYLRLYCSKIPQLIPLQINVIPEIIRIINITKKIPLHIKILLLVFRHFPSFSL